MDSCPTVALSQVKDSGVIEIDKDLCNLCFACVQACPYHAIFYNEKQEKLYICDLCNGHPTCVRLCTSGALKL